MDNFVSQSLKCLRNIVLTILEVALPKIYSCPYKLFIMMKRYQNL